MIQIKNFKTEMTIRSYRASNMSKTTNLSQRFVPAYLTNSVCIPPNTAYLAESTPRGVNR